MLQNVVSPEEYHFILGRDFTSFIERSFYELNPQTRLFLGAHVEVIAAKLEACRQGRIKRLIINLPPRHLKSHCASIAYVAWYLGHHPAGHVICASYGQDLADKLARDCRTVMMSVWYKQLFPTRLAERITLLVANCDSDVAYVYELPFGNGKKFGPHSDRTASHS